MIGVPIGFNAEIATMGCYPVADVNNDDSIDIVDALLVARYYVGLEVEFHHLEVIFRFSADVNCDGSVDIIDALLIAQYYVGLDVTFCRATD